MPTIQANPESSRRSMFSLSRKEDSKRSSSCLPKLRNSRALLPDGSQPASIAASTGRASSTTQSDSPEAAKRVIDRLRDGGWLERNKALGEARIPATGDADIVGRCDRVEIVPNPPRPQTTDSLSHLCPIC